MALTTALQGNTRDTPATGTAARLREALSRPAGVVALRILLFVLIVGAVEIFPWPASAKLWMIKPSAIVQTAWAWFVEGLVWKHLSSTLVTMSLGYVTGCVLGICGGLLLGLLPRVNRILTPFLAAANALPKIALAPLLIIVFGLGYASKVPLVAATVFFLVLSSTLDGVKNADLDTLDCMKIMGATRIEQICKVLLPSALPWVFMGMRISVRYAFTNTILAELIGANSGLGYLIESHASQFDATGTYAAVLILVIVSVSLTEILVKLENLMAKRE
jgi:NitT/TauT family transport system permease protein